MSRWPTRASRSGSRSSTTISGGRLGGIREASQGTGPTGAGDGNPSTTAIPTFTPLGAPASNLTGPNFTPPFPSYPSGHAGFGGALFQMLRHFYGTDSVPFTFVSDEFNGETLGNDGKARPLTPRSFALVLGGRGGERPESHLPRHSLGVRQDGGHRARQASRANTSWISLAFVRRIGPISYAAIAIATSTKPKRRTPRTGGRGNASACARVSQPVLRKLSVSCAH